MSVLSLNSYWIGTCTGKLTRYVGRVWTFRKHPVFEPHEHILPVPCKAPSECRFQWVHVGYFCLNRPSLLPTLKRNCVASNEYNDRPLPMKLEFKKNHVNDL